MIYLALSILSSSSLFVLFKLFDRFRVQTLLAIVVNYFIAFASGLIFYGKPIALQHIPSASWFPGSILMGLLFLTVFNVMALTAQKNGLSIASVAGKMSVVIPIAAGLFLYKEHIGIYKSTGIVLALISVWLTSVKHPKILQSHTNLWLPILLFLGSGVIDTLIKYYQNFHVADEETALFSSFIFLMAGSFGLLTIILKSLKKRVSFDSKSILGGFVLGVVNFFSMYYLLRALQSEQWNSATIFTLNNVAVVMLTTLMGLFLFREQLHPKNWLGIVLAVVSIALMRFA